MTEPQGTIYVFGAYELDTQRYQLRRAGEPLPLEPKVFDVLTYLVHHCGRLVSKDELLEQVWCGASVGEAALVRCIVAARKAISDKADIQEVIQTIRGRGYRFVAPVTMAVPATARGACPAPHMPCRQSRPPFARPPAAVLAEGASPRPGHSACMKQGPWGARPGQRGRWHAAAWQGRGNEAE